jgi:hypothetical protein
MAATAAGCGVMVLVAYAHLSPTIQLWWPYAFVHHSSPAVLVSSLKSVSWQLLDGLLGFSGFSGTAQALVVVLCLGLAIAGVYRNAAMLAPALTVAVAYVASAAHRVPLGTGRTDLYLYPAVLLLLFSGMTALARPVVASLRRHLHGVPTFARGAGALAALIGVVVGGLLFAHVAASPPDYPGVDVRGLSSDISRVAQPGDHVFVSELARFPWAAESGTPYSLRFGAQWAPGFTVVSRDPRVYLALSEYLEGGSHPAAWAAAERDAHVHRLWYVWSPPLRPTNPSYAALRHDGFRPVRTLHATGISAVLLVRP